MESFKIKLETVVQPKVS